MKKLILIFLLAILASANASSFSVARIGISQAQLRNQSFEKASDNILTFGIGRRYHSWEPSHLYWGFDVINSQAKLVTQKVLYPEIAPGFENEARIVHFDINNTNIEIPILLGYSYNVFKKSSISIENGFLFSFAYKMDYKYNLDGGIIV